MTLRDFTKLCTEVRGYICILGKTYYEDDDWEVDIIWDSPVNIANNLSKIPKIMMDETVEEFSFGLSGDGYPTLTILLDTDTEGMVLT